MKSWEGVEKKEEKKFIKIDGMSIVLRKKCNRLANCLKIIFLFKNFSEKFFVVVNIEKYMKML